VGAFGHRYRPYNNNYQNGETSYLDQDNNIAVDSAKPISN
jgi:hypothetical protein